MVRGMGHEDRNREYFSNICMIGLNERERLAIIRQDIAYQRLQDLKNLRAVNAAAKANCEAKLCQKEHDPLFYYCPNEKTRANDV